ncbi:MAG: type III-B CRISPR module RAMP protein Cmr4 [Peptococcaceae bacterium]|nr:type III-B CRISPR module RAMP protein Cmr4 [Peptococcaceae bacterium]
MKALVLGLLAETQLHPGSGQNVGAIDLPVSREAKTQYPVIYGSGLKGALKEKCGQLEKFDADLVFGKPDNAGAVGVTDARLLLLPLRSLSGHFKLATCTYILQRLKRDLKLAGQDASFAVPVPEPSQVLVAKKSDDTMYLEEFIFSVEKDSSLKEVIEKISTLVLHEDVRGRLEGQVVVLNDHDFSYFAANGLPVTARNQLDNDTKTSKNLWYEETLPPDTLMYSLLIPRRGKEDSLQQVFKAFESSPYLQVGGNETVGQGWCAVKILKGGEGQAV